MAAKTMNTLFNMHWYKQHIQGKHEVMIGYSDSARMLAFMSANWAQYRARRTDRCRSKIMGCN